jgi:DNA-binding NarL/FixJ family response regulator
MKKILLVDDHSILLNGLKLIIEENENFKVVGLANNWVDALMLNSTLEPDLILMDIYLPKRNGLEMAKEILAANPKQLILIFSMEENVDYVMKSIEIGCKGYLLKSTSKTEILSGMIEVLKGNTYYCKSISQIMVNNMLIKSEFGQIPNLISKREKEIISYICDGLASKEIASKCFISISTVETHRTNIYKKLKVNNSVQLLHEALKLGIFTIK